MNVKERNLPAELETYKRIREDIAKDFPDLDDETLSDTVEGLTSLREVLEEIIRSALEDEALLHSLSQRLADMRERLRRLEARADRKRRLVARALHDAEIPRIEVADFTAFSRRAAPQLELVNEELVPAVYWKPQAPKLDRAAVISALKSGALVNGARLSIGEPQLTVRTK